MSNKPDRFNPYIPSNVNDAFFQKYVNDNTTIHSSNKLKKETPLPTEINQELKNALNQIEILKAERNQLRNTLKTVLQRRSSDNNLDDNTIHNLKTPEYRFVSPRNNFFGLEKKAYQLQEENDQLRNELQKNNDELSILRKENQNYLEKIAEIETINNYNLQLKGEMEKINRELVAIMSRVKQLEEEKFQNLNGFSGEDLSPQAIEYINYTIQLLRDCDSNHFLRNCFNSRFENEEKIQELVEANKLGSIILRSFKYISDLVVNVNAVEPFSKNGVFPNQIQSAKKRLENELAVSTFNSDCQNDHVTDQESDGNAKISRFEEKMTQHDHVEFKSSQESPKISSPKKDAEISHQDSSNLNKNGNDHSKELKNIITNISTLSLEKNQGKDIELSAIQIKETTNAEPHFVLDTPRETLQAEEKQPSITQEDNPRKQSKPSSAKTHQIDQNYPNRDSQDQANLRLNHNQNSSLQQKNTQEIPSTIARNIHQQIPQAQNSDQLVNNYSKEMARSDSQSRSMGGSYQFQNSQKQTSSVGQGSDNPISHNQLATQIPVGFQSYTQPGYFQHYPQQNIQIKYVEPQFYRRQSEQLSTRVPINANNPNYSQNYALDQIFIQGQRSPSNKIYVSNQQSYNEECIRNREDNEKVFRDSYHLESSYPNQQYLSQPYNYQPSPLHQQFYRGSSTSCMLNSNEAKFIDSNNPGYNVDNSYAQLETQDSYENTLQSREAYLTESLNQRRYMLDDSTFKFNNSMRNNPLLQRNSEPVIIRNPHSNDPVNLKPTYFSGQERNVSLQGPLPNNQFVQTNDGKHYNQFYSPKAGAIKLENSQFFLSNSNISNPDLIAPELKNNFEIIPEESDRYKYKEIKYNHAKQIQIEAPEIRQSSQITGNNYYNYKATQTSPYSPTASSKLSSITRENIPAQDFGFSTIKKNTERPVPSNEIKKQNFQKRNTDKIQSLAPKQISTPSRFANQTSQDNTKLIDSNPENSQTAYRNRHITSLENSDHEQNPVRVSRATLGVMGNQDLEQKPAKKTLNVSHEVLPGPLNSPNQKSFRVSFGKTVSLTGPASQEKPRFEIVPNDWICIVEAPRKKHIDQQRKFDIISNEPKTTKTTSEPSDLGNPSARTES